jgi:coproporphyrinogen III oxidase
MTSPAYKNKNDFPPPSFSPLQAPAQAWFESLRDQIIAAFEAIDDQGASLMGADLKPGRFEKKTWEHPQGGGGTMALMRGAVFEKVGVNISTVWGQFSEEFRHQIPGTQNDPTFWASGISLVAHMRSPHVPAVHMNTRHIVTAGKQWFGGGADLNPAIVYAQDTQDFHAAFQKACDAFHPTAYQRYKEDCDQYFYIKHRQETRGVGGIFYDYLTEPSLEACFNFTKEVGSAFAHIYPELVNRRAPLSWTAEEKDIQLHKRGRYTEFNLMYDRGTLFGLKTGGNVEAILMSLPPEARW